jgi:YesN/AraC family two-component response regulator
MYNVLLVDDEKWVRTSIKRVMEKTELPFKVIREASNGLEALDWLREEQADLIFTDVRMPVMNGMTFVQQVRESSREQQVMVISGFDDFQYVQYALRMGAFDYLLKPVEVSDMKDCLQKWINEQLLSNKRAELNEANPRDPQEKSPIKRVIEYIHQNLSEKLTLADAAAQIHLHPNYLSQLFKQQLGRNFIDYIVGVRMEEAMKLLLLTSLRVNEIANRLGYTDIAYFSNTFKKWSGYNPSDYRKEKLEEVLRLSLP